MTLSVVNISKLAAESMALANFFYNEQCHYTTPLASLQAVFGAAQCKFAKQNDMHTLLLEPSGLSFSIFERIGASEDDHKNELAQCALQSLPTRRVAELMNLSVLHNDKSLAASPIVVKLTVSNLTPPPPSRKRARRQETVPVATSKCGVPTLEAMKNQLADLCQCEVRDIIFEFIRENAAGSLYIKCVIKTPKLRFDPYVLCKTSATAEQHALIGALASLIAV